MTLDPPPCVALGVRDSAGQWQLALIALHCRSPPSSNHIQRNGWSISSYPQLGGLKWGGGGTENSGYQ